MKQSTSDMGHVSKWMNEGGKQFLKLVEQHKQERCILV